MKKKVFICLLVSILLVASLPMAAVAEEPTQTISVLWWGAQTRHDQTMQLIDKFMEKYPDIKVEPEFTDWNGYWSKLSTQVAGGLIPDVLQMDYAYLSQYAENGILAELDDYMESGDLNVEDVAENVLESGKVNGSTYALSCGTNVPVLMYRTDLLEEAGCELPMRPTLSEYIEISKTVYDKTGMTDSFIVSTFIDQLRFRLRSMGLELYNEDGTALGFDDPSYIVDMWTTIMQAQDDGFGTMIGEEEATSPFNAFLTDSWAEYHNSNELRAYMESTGLNLGMVAIPELDDAVRPSTYLKPTMFWSVSEKSEQKDAAITFINFFANDPDCYDIVGIERGIPISSKMRDHVQDSLSEDDQRVAEIVNYFSEEGNSSPIMPPDPAKHNEVSELLGQYGEQLRYEMIDDYEAAALQFMEEANDILAN